MRPLTLCSALRSAPLLVMLLSAAAHADYFLHGDQKADLITHGEMNGEDGGRYNVWIVPGYAGPAQGAKEGWSDAGRAVGEYGNKSLYKDAVKTGKSALRFAGKDSIGKFAFKGSYNAWGESLATASARTEKRVFGWWFAYPWAAIEASGESAVRMALGVPGGIIIGGVGSTVVPVAELLWPATKGIYHSTIPGTVMPLAAGGWNTIIAPPMALLGQQPNAARADGFWLKRIDPAKTDVELVAAKNALNEWRTTLLSTPEARALTAEQTALRESYARRRDEVLKQLHEQYEADQAKAQEQWQQTIQQQAALHEPELDASIDRQKLDALVQRYGRSTMIDALTGPGLDRTEAEVMLTRLIGSETGPKVIAQPEHRSDDDKTDPLRRSLQLGTESL